MAQQHPFQKFLGVNETADPFRLLALTPGQTREQVVDQALRSQLARIDRHPESGSRDAEYVRRQLRDASRAIQEAVRQKAGAGPINPLNPPEATPEDVSFSAEPAPGPANPVNPLEAAARNGEDKSRGPAAATVNPRTVRPPQRAHARLDLTPFDRLVLAILVAYGGWNAESRAKLVAIAASHGVSPQGLMKVVTGLSQYAASGGGRVDVSQITQGASRFQEASVESGAAPVRADSTSWRRFHVEERKTAQRWATTKLAGVFGALAIAFVVLLWQFLANVGPSEGVSPSEPGEGGTRVAQGASTPDESEDAGDAAKVEPPPSDAPFIAVYPELPSFKTDASPEEATIAADRSPRLPEQFDELARKVTVASTLSEQSRRDWRYLNDQAGLAWTLIDEPTIDAIKTDVFETLYVASDRPTELQSLVRDLATIGERFDEPLDLWRGAWAAGILGESVGRSDVPSTLRREADEHLDRLLPQRPESPGFAPAARGWLDAQMSRLVRLTEFDSRAFEYWELWLAAHEAIGGGDAYNASLMSALEAFLDTTVDLGRPGPSVDVVGRLLTEADFRDSAVVRSRIVAIFNDTDRDGRDLWVLGSLLAQLDTAPWFEPGFVPEPDALLAERRAAADAIAAAWPLAEGRTRLTAGQAIEVDAEIGLRWRQAAEQHLTLLENMKRPVMRREAQMLEHMVLTTWINEAAAAMAARQNEQALRILERYAAGWDALFQQPTGGGRSNTRPLRPQLPGPGAPLQPGGGGNQPPVQPGQARGVDGEWAEAFTSSGQTAGDRLEVLQSLRDSAGSDLGPIDAEAFVSVVYRGHTSRLRETARIMLLERFTLGPNVTLALLNQFAEAPRTEETSNVIAEFTGRPLPSTGTAEWIRQARLALVTHALQLHRPESVEFDRLAAGFAEAYLNRAKMREPEGDQNASQSLTPLEAVERLAAILRERAATMMVAAPVPGDLVELDRRRATRMSLAKSALERSVAAQVGVLELLAYITAGEQPILQEQVAGVIDDERDDRARARHVLEQALATESAMTRLWLLRIGVPEAQAASENERSTP